MIGGFIITGSEPKRVIVRAIGPSLMVSGVPVPDRLADPILELYTQGVASVIGSNDNWRDDQQVEIETTDLAPTDNLESAIIATLLPAAYTAIVSGKGQTSGIGLVEIYDLDGGTAARLANISTRGFVQTQDNVMIGGFILGGGSGNSSVIIRAIGPSLAPLGISNPLADPILELRDANGDLVVENDNWRELQEAEILASGLAPQNILESAIARDLAPGAFTVIVRGKDEGVGVGLVEVYSVN
jgi:hypothetical protein